MGERERGYRRVTMLTGGLAAVSIAGTLGVAVAAHAEHTAEQNTNVPVTPVDAGAVPQPADGGGQPAPVGDNGSIAVDEPSAASDGQVETTDQTPADPPVQNPPAANPAGEFPPVTDGGGAPGQATSGGS